MKLEYMDYLVTIALLALIYFAHHNAIVDKGVVDLAGFGEAVGVILFGRGCHYAGKAWGDAQGQ